MAKQIFPNIIMRPISSSCWKTIYQEICAYLVLVIICFFENGVLVACDLNFRLCRTFCNNISLTFHPMQDSAIFCTFFPVFISIAQNILKLLLNFHQAWKLVPSGRWSLCIITASPCALRREGVQKNENKLSHLQFRVVFWPKTLVFF